MSSRSARRLAGVVLGLSVATAVTAALAADKPPGVAGGVVAGWITQAHGSQRLARLPNATLSPRVGDAIDIVVDPAERYQRMIGFGAALTDASAFLLRHRMNSWQRRPLMRELFGRDHGIGLSFLRLTIGASDFSRRHYSLDDVPPGSQDPRLAHFSIDPERDAVLPLVKQALALNPDLKVMASPWSAPAWMKTSDNLISGRLREDRFQIFAEYLSRYVQSFEKEGVPIFAITVQNEPHFEPRNYPGMRLATDARRRFIAGYLGPLFARRHPGTRILEWDHNWNEPQAPLGVLADPSARRYIAGVAWHCYRGNPSAQSIVHDAYPGLETYLTECSGGGWEPRGFDPLTGIASGLLVSSTRNWASGVLLWNLALDREAGPHKGGCPDCRGVVTVDETTGHVRRNPEYYVLAHFSRFVLPGAVRVGSGAGRDGIDDVAFQNPDGSLVLVVVNTNRRRSAFTAGTNDCKFGATLPPLSVATYVWMPSDRCGSPDRSGA